MTNCDVGATSFSKNIHKDFCENFMEDVELMSKKMSQEFRAISAVVFELSRKYGRMAESAPQSRYVLMGTKLFQFNCLR